MSLCTEYFKKVVLRPVSGGGANSRITLFLSSEGLAIDTKTSVSREYWSFHMGLLGIA